MKTAFDKILLAHGSGGRLTHELIQTLFKPAFSNPVLNSFDDAALVRAGKTSALAFTTDSFVVYPLVFPGGDIGKLAVCGTVNDLAMKGAQPLALSVAAIIEEGLAVSTLTKVTRSIAAAAKEAGVHIVTGDTKVVERGKADRLFLTTSGIGAVPKGVTVGGSHARPGDEVLINGTIADHGVAVLLARNDFKLSAAIKSDCAPLNGLVRKIIAASKDIHVLRDPTRGGVATTLNEIASASAVGIIIDERSLPVRQTVRSACNVLGLDPLYVANEGKVLAILPEKSGVKALRAMKTDRYGKEATRIGTVVSSPRGVWLKTSAGGLRPLVMLEGEQLPRIC
jgi:hydrogenase expression/formation protein HypE